MADEWVPPTFGKQGEGNGKSQKEKIRPGSTQNQASEEFSVERTCTTVKVKIEKLEDEEKEKMSFYPKGNSNLIHYLCKHDLANLAVEQNWKLILENRDQKLVIKLQVKKEVPIENCRDKVRKLIVKAFPTLHQEKCYLSSLSNRDCSNSYQGNKDPLQQALACLVPLVKASQNQADLLYDKDLNCVIITGPKETVKQLHIEAKVKLYSVTMETGLESPSHGCLLRTFRVMDQLRGQYPGLTAVVQDCNMRVRWTGTEENIGQGRQEMEKFIREIKTETFLVSSVMKKLLLTPEIKHYIDSVLEKEGITCVWQVMETGQIQIWSIQASSSKRAGHKIRENCREETFSVKDFPFILDVSKIGFGLATTEMKHFSVEETSDTVHVAAKSNTMQKIIQYLQDLEDKQTPRKQPTVHQEGDNSRSEKTTGGCTIEVRGMDKTTSNDMVELYFESKRAGGRPVDIENFDASKREKNGVIFITYKNKEDAQLVLGRQHTLDQSSLTVRLFTAPEPSPSFYQEKVFFGNMNPNTTQKVLENFLKSKVTVSPIEFLYGEEEGTVLVTFDGDPDFDKLKNACQNSMLEDCQLEAMQVPVSYSVVVSGVENCTSLDTLELYFENTRRSGGGDVTEVKEISDGYFLITFKDSGVIDRVCQRTHKVDGKVITVQTFYEKLGHRVNHTRQTFKIPSPLVIKDQNKIHQLVTSDITKLEKQLSDHHAKLHWPGDMSGHLKLECLITEDDLDSSRLVISWEKAIQNILSNFLTTAGTTKAQVVVISPDVEVSTKNSSAIKKDRDLNKGDDIRVHDTKDHLSSSQEDYEHIPDINIEMPEKTQTDRHKVCPSLTLSPTSWKSADFTTAEGLLVRVYPGSILHLDVDCIVNAANENLQHGGGVAYVISYAAGYNFDRESRDYVYDHGPLRVGEVCTTTAGNLKYKGVIHSVGPRWHDYSHDQKWICLDVLKTAVKNSLDEADIQMYKSIAIPAISSGIFGVPKEHCTLQYYRAVEEYSRTRGRHSTLTEVHFIDKDTQMCALIQKTFTKCFTGNAGSSDYGAGPGGRGGNFLSSVMSPRNTGSSNYVKKGQTDTDIAGHDRGAGYIEVTENCCICMDTMTKPKKLSCGHMFCTDCIDKQFKYKPACPQCGAVHGKITGDQPPGTMSMKTTKMYWRGGGSLPGYEGCGIINITYTFPPGKQGPDHPTPGKHYQGITKPGFLPDNNKGRLVAKLLKIAFDRKLVFTIGRSRTTGHDGVVTWNDIHHKTRMDGGPQAFGYPDPTYLDRVLDELKAKGVTECYRIL